MVLGCYESNITKGLSIRATIFELWRVSSRFPSPFKDTRQISTGGIKTKPSNGIEFHFLLQVCFGKENMATMHIHLLNTFFKILAYHVEIALHITEQNLA